MRNLEQNNETKKKKQIPTTLPNCCNAELGMVNPFFFPVCFVRKRVWKQEVITWHQRYFLFSCFIFTLFRMWKCP